MAFKVDFSSSLAAPAAEAASKKMRIHCAGWATCGFYQKTKTVLQSLQTLFPDQYEVVVHESATRDEFRAVMPPLREQFASPEARAHTSSPFVCSGADLKASPAACDFIGGCDATLGWARGLFGGGGARKAAGGAARMAADGYSTPNDYEYDLVVIGGGSGGLAASKEAAKLGARVTRANCS